MAAAGVITRFWSPAAAPAGRMPGVTSTMLGRIKRAQPRRLLGRADQPVDPDVARLGGALGHQLRHREIVAGGRQIGVVVGGEHGDGEEAQLGAGARLDRGMHGLRIGVHGEKRRAQAGDAFDPARDRVADIVQLHVDEDLVAGLRQVLRETEPARKAELVADLVEAHRGAQTLHQRLRLRHRSDVERHDQPFARIKGHEFDPFTATAAHSRPAAAPRS